MTGLFLSYIHTVVVVVCVCVCLYKVKIKNLAENIYNVAIMG